MKKNISIKNIGKETLKVAVIYAGCYFIGRVIGALFSYYYYFIKDKKTNGKE